MTHDMQRVTPAAELAPLVTLADAKQHLNIAHLAQDALVSSYIAAVEDYLDGYDGVLGRALRRQRWTLTLNSVAPQSLVRLPLVPFVALHAIDYDTTAATAVSLNLADVRARRDEGFGLVAPAFGKTWPSDIEEIRITYDLGHDIATETKLAARVKSAALLMIEDLYVNRSAGVEGKIIGVNPAVQRLLAPLIVRSWRT